jgi:hypothetical protein
MARQTVLSEDEQELEELKRQVSETPEGSVAVSPEEGAGAIEPEAAEVEQPEADDVPSQRVRGPDGKYQKFVPHAALHQARQETRGEKEARQKLERDFAEFKGRAEERLRFLMEAREQNKPQPAAEAKPQIPDKAADPLGYAFATIEAQQAAIEELKKGSSQTREQQEAQVRQARAINALQADEQNYAAKVPDYWDATAHLQSMWIAEGRAAGIPDQMVPNLIRARMAEVIQAAQATQKSPAEIAYALAGARGYTKAQPQQEQAAQADLKLANLKKGTEAARSLGAGGAPPASDTPLIDLIMSKSDDELLTWAKKNPDEYYAAMGQAQKQAQRH